MTAKATNISSSNSHTGSRLSSGRQIRPGQVSGPSTLLGQKQNSLRIASSSNPRFLTGSHRTNLNIASQKRLRA